jgi:hypothetical protein
LSGISQFQKDKQVINSHIFKKEQTSLLSLSNPLNLNSSGGNPLMLSKTDGNTAGNPDGNTAGNPDGKTDGK